MAAIRWFVDDWNGAEGLRLEIPEEPTPVERARREFDLEREFAEQVAARVDYLCYVDGE